MNSGTGVSGKLPDEIHGAASLKLNSLIFERKGPVAIVRSNKVKFTCVLKQHR